MILITGGLGFIGSHTSRALLDMGQSCVLVQRRSGEVPSVLADELDKRVFPAQADITDAAQLLAVGERYPITGIVHLAAGGWPPSSDPIADARHSVDALLNVLEAAQVWGVSRIGVASTIGVYGGSEAGGACREDSPLPMSGGHAIPTFKKVGELLGGHIAASTGLAVHQLRIAGIWGPLGRPVSRFFGAPQLIHAAANDVHADLSDLYAPPHLDDGIDLCYVKDCARAIALLQLAPTLNHDTYNVGTGRVTTYRELVGAITAVAPLAPIGVPECDAGDGISAAQLCLDISRLREDTGFLPTYDTAKATADYLAWLRAGNAR